MNKNRDLKGRYAKGLKFKKTCIKCHKVFNVIEALREKKYCSQICYLNNIFGKNNPAWKGGLLKQKNYRKNYNKIYRHEHNISKRYNDRLGISKTKEYKKLHRKMYKYSFEQAGKLDIKTIQKVYESNIKKYGTLTCYLCLDPVEFKKDHLEHKTPLSRGGTNEYKNLAIACQKCNCKKHNKTEKEYRKELCTHD